MKVISVTDYMRDEQLQTLAQAIGNQLHGKGIMLATAESCTGGWVGKVITDIVGSSSWFDRGFITYTNKAKRDMLGVSSETLNAFGAVSEETVCEMVKGALEHSNADLALAITGIAGPGGATAEKPLGTVWLAWGNRDGFLHSERHQFIGEREAVRQQAVACALDGVLKHLLRKL
jgi:nicotinamide-nucleotide amidase